jgi:hypothetical protein
VAPESFGFPGETDIWVLMDESTAPPSVGVVGRLQDGVSVAQANVALAAASIDVGSANGRPRSLKRWSHPPS